MISCDLQSAKLYVSVTKTDWFNRGEGGEKMDTSPKQIGFRNYLTHGTTQFANLVDAEEYSALMISQYAGHDCGYYWSAGDINEGADGTFWVVTP